MSDRFDIKIPDGLPDLKPATVIKLVIPLVVVAVAVAIGYSGYTHLEPGEVAVIKNNVTGAESVRTESGIILHLPLGLTDVYKLDRRVQVLTMGKKPSTSTRSRTWLKSSSDRSVQNNNVKIKVADGSNVELDVEVNLRVIPTEAAAIIRKVGVGDAFKTKMIRSYTRALIREKYGKLKLEEVSDPATRTTKNVEVQRDLNRALKPFGTEITLVNTTNFTFNTEYEKLVKEKKATAQEYTNQKAAQEKALKEQEAEVARGTREKNTAIITAQGEARKRIVEADAKAKQLILRARGEAYAKNKEGDRSFEVAANEAKAVEAEGLNMAAGIQKLTDAYSRGGSALVKEALARKLAGRQIHGRPYSLSESIERIRIDRAAATPEARRASEGGKP
jgi:regulator of protease activity HflC (stomatin/prohibitin superfamily)